MDRLRAAIVATILFSFGAPALPGQSGDKPVATIRLTRTQVITASQLARRLALPQTQAQRELSREEKSQYLDQMVIRALVEQAAERDRIAASDAEVTARIAEYRSTIAASLNRGNEMSDADLQSSLSGMGMSWAEFQDQVRYEVVRLDFVRSRKGAGVDSVGTPTDADIEDAYNYHKKDYVSDDMVRVSHIFIDMRALADPGDADKARKHAEDILRELKGGAPFEDVQMQYSEDTAAKYRGGDLGIIARLDSQRQQLFGKAFIDALFRLRKGDTSGIIPSNIGLHIVRITEKYDAVLLALEDRIPPAFQATVRDFIRRNLTIQRQNDAFAKVLAEVIAELRTQAEVRVFPENLP